MRTSEILGYQVEKNPAEEIELALLKKCTGQAKYCFCLNPHSLIEAERDIRFKAALKSANFLIADGVGITIAAPILGVESPRRYTGSDLFEMINSSDIFGEKKRVFLMGSTSETLTKMAQKMENYYPHLEIVGMISPPFDDEDLQCKSDDIVRSINNAFPDILWVGMTAPKQELWVYEHGPNLRVDFIGCVGAVFDFFSGTKSRPSKYLRALGLEWLGRLLTEPRRLWRRTIISGLKFINLVIMKKIRGNSR